MLHCGSFWVPFFTGFVLFLWYVAQLYIYLIPFVLAEKPTAMNVTALVVALASLWVMWYLLFGTAAFGNESRRTAPKTRWLNKWQEKVCNYVERVATHVHLYQHLQRGCQMVPKGYQFSIP